MAEAVAIKVAAALAIQQGTTAFLAVQVATTLALTVATNAIVSALTPVPPSPKQSLLVNSRDATAPQEFVYGEVRKGGPITYLETTRGGSVLYQIIPLAAHEIESVEAIYVNDKEVTLSPDGYDNGERVGAGWVTDDQWSEDGGEHELRIFYHLGNQTTKFSTFANSSVESLDTVFFNTGSADEDSQNFGGVGQPTRESFIGNGIAYLFVRYSYASGVYRNGIPVITARIKGKKVYNPDTGVTEYSNNAALCIRDFLTSAYGLNDPQVNDTVFINAANICDEDVLLADGITTEKRYTLNGVVRADQTYGDVLQQMITSCAGTLFWGGGKWKLTVGDYNAPTKTFTLDDLRSNISLQTRTNLRDQFNRVQGTFVNQDNRYITEDYPPYPPTADYPTSAFLAQDDGVEQALDLDLPFTTSSATAQRLAKMTLFRGREQMVFSADFGLNAFDVEVGEIVALTVERYGWTEKEFEVVGWNFNSSSEGGDLRVTLTLRETSEAAFAWDGEEEDIISNDSSLLTTLEPVTNLTATLNGTVSTDGTFLNKILVDWDSVVGSTGYEVEWMVNQFNYTNSGGIVEEVDAITTREQFIYKAYVEILYRQPDQDGFDFYNTGGGSSLTEEQLRSQLAASPERTSLTFSGLTVYNPTTEYTIQPTLDQTIYNIRVRAVTNYGVKSLWKSVTISSLKDGTTPNTPTSVVATGSYRSTSVTWTAPTANTDDTSLDDLAYYVIYRGTSANPTTEHAKTSSNTFVDTKDILDNTTYHYRVKAFDFSGNDSPYSASVSATTAPYDANAIRLSSETGRTLTFTADSEGNLAILNGGISPDQLGSMSLSSSGLVTGVGLADSGLFENRVLKTGHGLADGDQIIFVKVNDSPTTIGNIQIGRPYYVVNTQSNTFQISQTLGGAAVDILPAENDILDFRSEYTTLVGTHINTEYWPDQFRAYQDSTTQYAAYFENLSTSGGTLQARSQGGFTSQFLTSTTGSGYAAIDAQNTATNGGKAQIGLSSANGGYGFNVPATSFAGYFAGAGTYDPFTGAHIGMIDNTVTPDVGDILVDLQVIARTISNCHTEVGLSSVVNEKGVIGICQSLRSNWIELPAFVDTEATQAAREADPENFEVVYFADQSVYHDDYDLVTINAVGEGSVNVCGEGGNISKGDLIVTSSIPGKGMKQADDIVRSYTVAKAREDVTFSDPTEVKMVACIYLCG